MTDRISIDDLTREELVSALRGCLRKLDGDTVWLDDEELEPREGERLSAKRRQGLIVELEGHLSNEHAAEILDAVDEGDDPIVSQSEPWRDTWAHVDYVTRAGHRINVYNRCGHWRYVDHIVHADGRRWEFSDGTGGSPWHRASTWHPGNREAWGMPPPEPAPTVASMFEAASNLARAIRGHRNEG